MCLIELILLNNYCNSVKELYKFESYYRISVIYFLSIHVSDDENIGATLLQVENLNSMYRH